jgi:competence protein ComEC
MRRTTLITVGCISILFGLGLARWIALDGIWWLVALPALLLVRKNSWLKMTLIIIIGLGLGLSRGSIYMQKLNQLKSLTGQKVTVVANVKTDAVYGKRSQIEFIANNAREVSPKRTALAGNFKISGFGVPMVYRGDRVEVTGKLYPMRGSNQARMAYTQIKILAVGDQWFDKFSRGFSTGMQNALPEPLASFALGLLVGQRSNLPQDIITQLTMVGLVHIVAVSGYNLTILVRAAQRLKINSKYQKTVLSLVLIGGFLLMTGFSASIVRAAIVSILSLWAWYYGRNLRPLLLIAFAAALTSYANPFYIWGDLGWYLSFLAFFGVFIIGPLITKLLFRRPPQLLTIVLIDTLSAEIMTFPLIMLTFGQMSLIALLANLLIVPLVPLAMLLSAVAAGAGMLMPAFAGWFAWPARLLLTYMLDFVKLLSDIPSIFLHVKISLALTLSIYILVIAGTYLLHRHIKLKKMALEQVSITQH